VFQVSGYPQAVPWQEYCGETGLLMACPGRLRTEDWKFLVYGVLLLTSGSLLLITVIVTGFLLPSKVANNLHNRVLTAHNAALATAYVTTGASHIIRHMTDVACIFLGMSAFYTSNLSE
jgi:hypothetical protein